MNMKPSYERPRLVRAGPEAKLCDGSVLPKTVRGGDDIGHLRRGLRFHGDDFFHRFPQSIPQQIPLRSEQLPG